MSIEIEDAKMTNLTVLQPINFQSCLPWHVKMQQKIANRLRITVPILFIMCLGILAAMRNANAYFFEGYFFEGRWEVSLEGTHQDNGFVDDPQYYSIPGPNQTLDIVWDIRYDGNNVHLLSASPGTRWENINISDVSYDNTKLAFNVYKFGWAGKQIGVMRYHLRSGNKSNLIGGEWQYECSGTSLDGFSKIKVKKNGILYMRRIEKD